MSAKQKMGYFVLLVVASVAIFVGYNQFLKPGDFGVALPRYLKCLELPYLYITPNFYNLQNLLKLDLPPAFGVYTFLPVFQAVFLHKDMSQVLPVIPWPVLHKSWYGMTYLANFYVDFGFAGLIVFPFLMGIGLTEVYLRIFQRPTVFGVIIYSIVAAVLMMSFLYNDFVKIQYWYFAAILLIMNGYCAKTNDVKYNVP
jgi:hypothetical protein